MRRKFYFMHRRMDGTELRFSERPNSLPTLEVKIVRHKGREFDHIERWHGFPPLRTMTGWACHKPYPNIEFTYWRRPHTGNIFTCDES